jgi:hypothetical protein
VYPEVQLLQELFADKLQVAQLLTDALHELQVLVVEFNM